MTTGTLFTPKERKTKVIGVAVTEATAERLHRIAAVHGVSVSEVGRTILEKFLADLDKEKPNERLPVPRSYPRR